jgi:hypothetical protein
MGFLDWLFKRDQQPVPTLRRGTGTLQDSELVYRRNMLTGTTVGAIDFGAGLPKGFLAAVGFELEVVSITPVGTPIDLIDAITKITFGGGTQHFRPKTIKETQVLFDLCNEGKQDRNQSAGTIAAAGKYLVLFDGPWASDGTDQIDITIDTSLIASAISYKCHVLYKQMTIPPPVVVDSVKMKGKTSADVEATYDGGRYYDLVVATADISALYLNKGANQRNITSFQNALINWKNYKDGDPVTTAAYYYANVGNLLGVDVTNASSVETVIAARKLRNVYVV